MDDLVFVILFIFVFSIFFKNIVFPYSYCLGLFISVCFLQLRLFHKCAASIFPLLIALHFLLLLSCFLPICMPKVEVCVSSVSMFTFRLCCYFPPTCSSLSMPFPNNGNAKTRWRSSYCGPERKIWGQKGNYNHGSFIKKTPLSSHWVEWLWGQQ